MDYNRIYEFLLGATFVMMLYFIKSGYIRAQKIMKEWAKGGIRESLLKRGTKDDWSTLIHALHQVDFVFVLNK